MPGMPTEYDIALRKGSSARITVRWETEPWLYAAIASISQAAPVGITLQAAAQIPDGWRVAVLDAKGLSQLNAQNNPAKKPDMRRASVASGTQLTFNELSGAGFGKHVANTGYIAWMTPHALAGYIARMDIKDRIGGTTLLTLNSVGGAIEINDSDKTITLIFEPADTEGVAWNSAIYDLEMVSAGGYVTPILFGPVTLTDEATTSP